jgi:hypothetical protein
MAMTTREALETGVPDMPVTSSERIRVPSSASGNPAVSGQEPGRATMH